MAASMTNTTKIRLITRGDDAGSCDSANQAIVEAARNGILRNVSIMVPGITFDTAVPLLKALPGSIALGLHVTLNAEWEQVKWKPVLPADQVPSLVDKNGDFWPTPNDTREQGGKADEVLAEIQAQYQKAVKSGLNISYIDEHMGMSWPWPEVRAGIAALAKREGLVYAPELLGLPINGSAADPNDFLAALAVAAPGTYVFVTHPGMDRDDMRQLGRAGMEPGQVARQRDADRRLLTSPRVRDEIARLRVEIIRYTDI